MKAPLVDLIAPPFSGHLHPLLGIGRALAQEVRVRVISTADAAARTRASGLEPRIMLDGMDADVRAIAETREAVGSDPRRLHAQFRATLAVLARFQAELRTLYREQPPDLAIVDFTLPVAGVAAREAGAAWWTSLPSPCVLETPDGPPAYLGGLRPRPDIAGRLRDAAGRALVRSFKRSVARLNRRTLCGLGLDGPYRADGTEAAYSGERILALGLAELEFARQWPRAVHFVGPVRYTPPGLEDPSSATPPFVPGRRHVLVTLGTHLRHRKDWLAEVTRDAARKLPHVSFHFTDGVVTDSNLTDESITEGSVTDGSVSDRRVTNADAEVIANFHRRPFITYDLVPRYDLVIHHGGAGILYETLAAGLPAIVLPQDYDQFDNAARLEAAGLAIRLRTPDDLPQAIERALVDAAATTATTAMRRRYRDLIVHQSPSPEALVLAMVREHCREHCS